MSETNDGRLPEAVHEALAAFQREAFTVNMATAYAMALDLKIQSGEQHPTYIPIMRSAMWLGLFTVREAVDLGYQDNGNKIHVLELGKINPDNGRVIRKSWCELGRQPTYLGELTPIWPFNNIHLSLGIRLLQRQKQLDWTPLA